MWQPDEFRHWLLGGSWGWTKQGLQHLCYLALANGFEHFKTWQPGWGAWWETHLTGSWSKSAGTANPWLNLIVSGRWIVSCVLLLCWHPEAAGSWRGGSVQPHAQQHSGVCPFPGQPVWNDLSSAKGFLCRSWGPRSLGLAVRGLSFRGQWCLLISWLNSVILEESRLCVCGSFGSKPCDVSLLFVSLRIRIYPLEAAVFCLVDGVPLGPKVRQPLPSQSGL